MQFIPVPLTCCVELRYALLGQTIENTLSFWKAEEWDLTSLQWIAEHVATWWFERLRLDQRNNLVYRETYARALYDKEGPAYTSTLYNGTAGSGSAGSILPGGVTYCVSFRTGGRGRSYRGRNYTCAMSTSHIAGNQVTSTYRNAVLDNYRRLLPGGSHDPTPARWVVVSRWHDKVARSPGIAIPILSVTVANDDTDSMRTRLAGRGK